MPKSSDHYEQHQELSDDDRPQNMDDLNQEELNAIIESITSGKSVSYKKLTFQAFCAAISHED